ncbi:helix-turn-helix transcriptional regulator [Sphingomonas crocodyli]|uniref:HTH luxR-type domain-containing protein n=1 Tax=Sphingomonas crocodyli TaxID=1979270 RepID=A0A437M631_9SPHN|nr:hypothetical protein [Sphingomonas crocodyli]RVT93180.1 hypothetical protein EOD43_04640 [Sphingomonas crocodyli]
MFDMDGYDALISGIYDAGTAGGSLSHMFELIRDAVGAAGAGVTIYDADDLMLTHTLVRSGRSISRRLMDKLLPMTDDPGAGLVTGARFPSARRFTDIVPEPQLRHARWFREQSALTSLGHGVMIDVDIAGIRVRLFAVRSTGAPNFSEDDVDLFDRIGPHLRRAFAKDVRRFSPFQAKRGLQVILYDEDRLAPAFVRDDPFDRQLAARYGLTAAELRALRVMAGGVTRAEAHGRLGIGANSLKTHMRRIYAKTGTRRLPELVLLVQALRGGQPASKPS